MLVSQVLVNFLTVREVDEAKDWINEKDAALNNDNYGHDLASVQALQRKHEGLERDLAALGEKVRIFRIFVVALGDRRKKFWKYYLMQWKRKNKLK